MANFFEKRATEYLREPEAFLSVVSPEPLTAYLEQYAKQDVLYDRPVIIVGSPGSGKTTLATLFQYSTVRTLLRNRDLPDRSAIIKALSQCGALENGNLSTIGCRLPIENEYREFWEFPYSDDIKNNLMTGLLQARAVLAWLRNLERDNIPLSQVRIVPKTNAEAATSQIGGTRATDVLSKARTVEELIYRISAALVPPPQNSIDEIVGFAYHPFDVIERIEVFDREGGKPYLSMQPLVIFDDVHILHPDQFNRMQKWLRNREIRVARWMLTRLDALTPKELFDAGATFESATAESGVNKSREITQIFLQKTESGLDTRRIFRRMARDMAERYLNHMPIFARSNIRRLTDLLDGSARPIANNQISNLVKRVDKDQRQLGVSVARRQEFEDRIIEYANSTRVDIGHDIQLMMLRIMMHRYAKRVPQQDLFSAESNPEPKKYIAADAGVAEGARIHLLQDYNRPYYYGIDRLADASSKNAETFLQLAARLVDQAETQLIRRSAQGATISAQRQHKLLRNRAAEIISQWNFPMCREVQNLVETLAGQCKEKSLETNAPLKGGANAVGIPQRDFDAILAADQKLAKVIKYGVAYNAMGIQKNRSVKNKIWCIIELSGVVILKHGLTLHDGGFIERNSADLEEILEKGSL